MIRWEGSLGINAWIDVRRDRRKIDRHSMLAASCLQDCLGEVVLNRYEGLVDNEEEPSNYADLLYARAQIRDKPLTQTLASNEHSSGIVANHGRRVRNIWIETP